MDVKSGWKTTEFWLTLVAVTLGALAASGLLADAGGVWERLAGVALSVLAALGYSTSRASVKKGGKTNAWFIMPLAIAASATLFACAPTWQGKVRQAINATSATASKARAVLAKVCRSQLELCKAEKRTYAECPELQQCQDKRRVAHNALLAAQHGLIAALAAVDAAEEKTAQSALRAAQEAIKRVGLALAAMGVIE